MSESNDAKPDPSKPVESNGSPPPVNHRKANLSVFRPLVPPKDKPELKIEPPKPLKPVIDDKLGFKDMRLKIIVELNDRQNVVVTRTFQSLLVNAKNHPEENISIGEIHRLFAVADTSTVTDFIEFLGPDIEPPKKQASENGEQLNGPMAAPYPGQVPGDMNLHNNPDIRGINESN